MSRSSLLAPRSSRRGLTLIELLVVIIILTTIVAAAIPIMAPADENRRLRETTRALTGFIAGAQTRAIALNRPVGVALKRLSQDTNTNPDKHFDWKADIHDDNGVCLEVFYVEQAPPYAGFDEANSRACVALHPDQIGLALVRFVTRGMDRSPNQDSLPVGWDADLFPENMIRPGDVIEINGTQFELLLPWFQDNWVTLNIEDKGNNDNSDGGTGYFDPPPPRSPLAVALVRPINDSGQQINPEHDDLGREIGSVADAQAPYWTNPAPYKILRQATPTSDEPYQLPEGTAIDLRASGVGSNNYFYVPDDESDYVVTDNSAGVLIMFAPEGRISRVSFSQMPPPSNNPNNQIAESNKFDGPVAENVYLLVGQRAKIPAPDAADATKDPTLSTTEWGKLKTEEQRLDKKEPINWLNSDSRWVVLGAQSGRVATIKNAFVDPQQHCTINAMSTNPTPESSEGMRTNQILLAREFTREMVQDEGR